MIPENVMVWIAGVFPLMSFLMGFGFQYVMKRAWIPTILVFGITLMSMLVWFTMYFWPWLLLYLILCWTGCWAGASTREWVSKRKGEEAFIKESANVSRR
jgi:hypothetical protein